MQFFFESTVFFLKRCKMSLNVHVAVPSFCLHPVARRRMFRF